MAFFDSCIDKTEYVTQSELPNYFKQDGEDSITHYPVTIPSGNKKLISFSSTPIYNKLGEIIAVEGFVMDQTEKILGDRGLDNFFNLSLDLHCIVHMNGYFLKVSPTWIDFLGFSEKELLSQTFLKFLHPEDIKSTLSIMDKIVYHGSTTRYENRYITKSL